MHGLYSYNVLDSPEYQQAKKIERRIAAYDKKMRQRQMKKMEQARIEAVKTAQSYNTMQPVRSGQQSPRDLSQVTINHALRESREVM